LPVGPELSQQTTRLEKYSLKLERADLRRLEALGLIGARLRGDGSNPKLRRRSPQSGPKPTVVTGERS